MNHIDSHARNAAALVAVTLVASVATQLAYFALLSGVGVIDGWPLRSAIWGSEVIIFTLMAVAALVGLAREPRYPVVFAALGVSAIANMAQASIGLGGFLPAAQAGESGTAVLSAMLGIAFLLYFLAKVLIGLAGIGLGLRLWRKASGAAKLAGAAAIVVGAVATVVNGFALPTGMAHVFPAGASGTAAALTTAIALWLAARSPADGARAS